MRSWKLYLLTVIYDWLGANSPMWFLWALIIIREFCQKRQSWFGVLPFDIDLECSFPSETVYLQFSQLPPRLGWKLMYTEWNYEVLCDYYSLISPKVEWAGHFLPPRNGTIILAIDFTQNTYKWRWNLEGEIPTSAKTQTVMFNRIYLPVDLATFLEADTRNT